MYAAETHEPQRAHQHSHQARHVGTRWGGRRAGQHSVTITLEYEGDMAASRCSFGQVVLPLLGLGRIGDSYAEGAVAQLSRQEKALAGFVADEATHSAQGRDIKTLHRALALLVWPWAPPRHTLRRTSTGLHTSSPCGYGAC